MYIPIFGNRIFGFFLILTISETRKYTLHLIQGHLTKE